MILRSIVVRNIMIKRKIIEWAKRYFVAEVFATLGAITGGILVNLIFHSSILTALGGTWGENTGYYGYIILKDLKERKTKDGQITFLGTLKVVRGIIIEFGPGEYLDSFIIRPTAMYIFPKILGNIALGLIVGKFAADFIFYIPTIIAYELKKKIIKD